MSKRKQTVGPFICNRCQRTVRNPNLIHHGREDSWTPPGFDLCEKCWSALDDYLCKYHKDIYRIPWKNIEPENIPTIHAIGCKWIAGPEAISPSSMIYIAFNASLHVVMPDTQRTLCMKDCRKWKQIQERVELLLGSRYSDLDLPICIHCRRKLKASMSGGQN